MMTSSVATGVLLDGSTLRVEFSLFGVRHSLGPRKNDQGHTVAVVRRSVQ